MGRRYFITEVFAQGTYSGNQLATVIDSDGLTTQEMQKIARAFNFAETTFYLGGDEAGGFDVRIFTPASELPFAGHPTLGTSYLIRQEIEKFKTPALTLNLGVGPIPVRFENDGIVWMQQNAPEFGAVLGRHDTASMLGLAESDLHPQHQAQLVSTGLEFLVVPLKDLAALKRALATGRLTAGLSADTGVLVFCDEGYLSDHQYASRMFAPGLGVDEDAATGSATGCLAAYLARHSFNGTQSVSATVGQGFEIGRPSALYMKAVDAESLVEVGGKVNLVSKGEWLL